MKKITPKNIQREWQLIDAKNQILGRISTQIARHLMGKNKSYYVSYIDTGDYVVVINAKDIMLSGKKEKQKRYYHHSGYPGGMYVKTAAQIKETKPELLLKHAVKGMLPKTVMGKNMLKKLYVFPETEHPYKNNFRKELNA